ncbi:glycerol-3-phosphate dehydrogenase [Streptomyces sp. AmelKG-E11A]|nr:glycerol-3-phosphate dehydrogenase [Streptomyces sp. AmelKG-E11A]
MNAPHAHAFAQVPAVQDSRNRPAQPAHVRPLARHAVPAHGVPAHAVPPATYGAVTRGGDLPAAVYDITVVGAGVVGSAVARELARYPALRTALVDARDDVGDGTSKANTAILHTGFDAVPGSLESRLVRDGSRLLAAYAADCGIPLERVGALLVAWDARQLAALPELAAKARRNGYDDTVLLDADAVRAREPHLGPGALGALAVPGESVVCPWSTTLAYATQAVRAGTDLHLNCRVDRVDQVTGAAGHHVLTTDRGALRTRWLVNAAGLRADELDLLLGQRDFTVRPRRGQLLVLDTPARDLVRHILLPVPTALGKGVLVTPTVHGNVLVGPTAEDLDGPDAKEDTATTAEGLAGLRAQGARIVPALLGAEVTAVYAGLRAATGHEDYRVRAHPAQRYVTLGGVRSTGLSASLALAAHTLDLLTGAGLDPGPSAALPPIRVPDLGRTAERPCVRADLIARDPAYGTLVCHCERVSLGEIRDALDSTVPPVTPDGLRRRTRARGGRCQGSHCGAAVRDLLRRAGGTPT